MADSQEREPQESEDSTSTMFTALVSLACIGAVLLCKEFARLLVSRCLVVMRDVATQTESPAPGAGTRCLGGALRVVDAQEREQQHFEGRYRAYNVNKLRELLRERGCHLSGGRFDLVQRLLRNDENT